METKNLEWLIENAIHGDISGDNADDLRITFKAAKELKALSARVARLEKALKKSVVDLERWRDGWSGKDCRFDRQTTISVIKLARRTLEEK